MKRKYLLLILIANALISISVNGQQLQGDAPKSLFDDNGEGISNIPPNLDQMYLNFINLMENPDPSLNHDKIKAQRWMTYVLPKYNIENGDVYSLDAFAEAYRSIYTSPLFCGQNDLANWMSDGPAHMPDWYNQPSGGWVDAIYNDPNNINTFLIGTRTSGIFRTIDGGNTWQCVTDNLSFPVLGTQQIINAPDNYQFLLAITGSEWSKGILGGIIYSNDGGITWNKTSQNLPQFHWLDFHPNIAGLVFATSDDDIYVSFDYGITWDVLGRPSTYLPGSGEPDEHKELFKIEVLNIFYDKCKF